MNNNEIIITCSKCMEENTVSLDRNYFVCRSCGERIPFDNEKYKDQQRVIMQRIFGAKPDKPESN